MAAPLAKPQEIRELAKALTLREQDIRVREIDVARREQELAARKRELTQARQELQQLELRFEAATGGPGGESSTAMAIVPAMGPMLARANATVARRVLAFLEMEPRAVSPGEIHDQLELPPPIETLRTTLWKMADAGVIARPFRGAYCAHQYLADVLRAATGVG